MNNTLSRNAYPSDLTQSQWDEIDLLLPRASEQGRAREHSLREVVNAMNYRWTTGCSWRMLPHDFPVWQTVYSYFRKWQSLGLLGEIRRILLSRKLRYRSSKRAPEMPEKTSPERPLSTSESPRPLPEATSPRLTSSHWPTESVQ